MAHPGGALPTRRETSPSTSTWVRVRPRGSLDRCFRSRWEESARALYAMNTGQAESIELAPGKTALTSP
jgi:hypothetical protein